MEPSGNRDITVSRTSTRRSARVKSPTTTVRAETVDIFQTDATTERETKLLASSQPAVIEGLTRVVDDGKLHRIVTELTTSVQTGQPLDLRAATGVDPTPELQTIVTNMAQQPQVLSESDVDTKWRRFQSQNGEFLYMPPLVRPPDMKTRCRFVDIPGSGDQKSNVSVAEFLDTNPAGEFGVFHFEPVPDTYVCFRLEALVHEIVQNVLLKPGGVQGGLDMSNPIFQRAKPSVVLSSLHGSAEYRVNIQRVNAHIDGLVQSGGRWTYFESDDHFQCFIKWTELYENFQQLYADICRGHDQSCRVWTQYRTNRKLFMNELIPDCAYYRQKYMNSNSWLGGAWRNGRMLVKFTKDLLSWMWDFSSLYYVVNNVRSVVCLAAKYMFVQNTFFVASVGVDVFNLVLKGVVGQYFLDVLRTFMVLGVGQTTAQWTVKQLVLKPLQNVIERVFGKCKSFFQGLDVRSKIMLSVVLGAGTAGCFAVAAPLSSALVACGSYAPGLVANPALWIVNMAWSSALIPMVTSALYLLFGTYTDSITSAFLGVLTLNLSCEYVPAHLNATCRRAVKYIYTYVQYKEIAYAVLDMGVSVLIATGIGPQAVLTGYKQWRAPNFVCELIPTH